MDWKRSKIGRRRDAKDLAASKPRAEGEGKPMSSRSSGSLDADDWEACGLERVIEK